MAGLKVFDGSIWRAVGVEDSYWDVLSATSGGSSVNLSWPPAAGSPVSYELSINDIIVNVGNVTSYSASSLTIGNNYNFKVRPVFSDSSVGGWSYFKNGSPTGFNSATGGTTTTVTNYNGTGQTWKVHTFTSNGTFVVTDSPGIYSFRVLCVGGGGGGTFGGGGAGGFVDTTTSLSTGSNSVVVGLGGGIGGNGGSSSISSITAGGGSAGGGTGSWAGGSSGTPTSYSGGGKPHPEYYGSGGGSGGSPSGYGVGAAALSNITGTNTYYAEGGQGGWTQASRRGDSRTYGLSGYGSGYDVTGYSPIANTGSGGAGGSGTNTGRGTSGAAGIVIISYRIA